LVGLYCVQTHSFLPSASFDVDLILQGRHFADINQIRFQRFECDYSNLHFWLGDRGSISIQHVPRDPGTVPVRDRDIVTLDHLPLWDITYQGARIRYRNSSASQRNAIEGTVEFCTREGLRIEFPDAAPLSEFYRLERAVRCFIDVLSNAQIQRSKLAAGPYGEVEIFHRSRTGRNGRQDPNRHYLPVEYGQVQADINSYLERWMAMYSTIESCLNLFFLGLHDQDINIENVFLGIMGALEAFHRSFFPGTFVDQNEYDSTIFTALQGAIPLGLDGGFRQSLTNKIRWGNEKSLRARLKALIRTLPRTTTFHEYREESFIERSVLTRNNFTHVVTSADNTYNSLELYRAVQRWQEVMRALLMVRLQLPESVIDGAIQSIQECRGDFFIY
jgi:hypothetical protein